MVHRILARCFLLLRNVVIPFARLLSLFFCFALWEPLLVQCPRSFDFFRRDRAVPFRLVGLIRRYLPILIGRRMGACAHCGFFFGDFLAFFFFNRVLGTFLIFPCVCPKCHFSSFYMPVCGRFMFPPWRLYCPEVCTILVQPRSHPVASIFCFLIPLYPAD